MNALSTARLVGCHSVLIDRITEWNQILAANGVNLLIINGFRSWSTQLALWRKGRDAAGNVVDPAAVVTWAPPGHSWHEFGLAADAAPLAASGVAIDWDDADPTWAKLLSTYAGVGLFCGKDFPPASGADGDVDHFQLVELPLSPSDEIRQTFIDGGVAAVWAELNLPSA